MKTLLTLVGLATSCLLSGCAHDTSTKAASKPDTETSASHSIVLAVTNNPPIAYQWQLYGTNTSGVRIIGTNTSGVTNQ